MRTIDNMKVGYLSAVRPIEGRTTFRINESGDEAIYGYSLVTWYTPHRSRTERNSEYTLLSERNVDKVVEWIIQDHLNMPLTRTLTKNNSDI
jgi:hypothetical protein